MAYAPQVISDDENIDSAGTDVESAMSNDDSIFLKMYKDVNELNEVLSYPLEATTQTTGNIMSFIMKQNEAT